MQNREQNQPFMLGDGRRRPIAAVLLALLLTGALVVLVGTITGPSPSLAQDMASGQSSPDLSAPASPISGTYQVMLPLIYRDWRPGPPEIVYLAADPPIVAPGQSATLSWGVNNELFGLSLSPGGINVTGLTSLQVWPAQTTRYILSAYNPLGTDSAEATVTVQPLPEITLFMANPDTIDVGGHSLLMWRVSESVTRLVLEPGVGDVTGQASATVWPTRTTFYTLTAYNAVGSAAAQTTVTVNPPTIYSFEANPGAVDQGEPSTLSWSVSQPVDSLTIEPGVGDVTGLDSVQVTPAQTTVYTLTAANSAGQDIEAVTVTVRLAPVITRFTADPTTINAGDSSTLQWVVTGEVDSLAIDHGVGDVTGLDSVQVWPGTMTTYRLTATSGWGSDTADVTVTVSGAPPDITSFTANPATINSGGSSNLAWSVSGTVTSLSIDHGVGDVTGLAGVQVWPAATTTYRLTATNAWGSDTVQTTVTVSVGGDPWWDARWRARALIEAQGSGYERFDKVVETAINFTTKLANAGLSGAFDEANLRVIEVDANGALLDAQVPFQFDRGAGYNATNNAAGTLVILMDGHTGAAETRRFYAYFDTTTNQNGKTPANVPAQVTLQDNVNWEGQSSFKVTTQNAVYYYHKQGAGFASMIDGEESDWISYHPGNGSSGEFRGVPNVATQIEGENVGVFHPGYTLSTSTVYRSGPIKITIRSVTNDDAWEKTWAIYPRYATMTLVRKPAALLYWFLYEGTPGGEISAGDFYYLQDGTRSGINTVIDGDMTGEEWIYFGDDLSDQVLYVISHQQDTAIDCHYVMESAMTVFGFGRDKSNYRRKYLNAVPGYFTIGFTDNADFQAVSKRIRSAYRPMTATVGAGELKP